MLVSDGQKGAVTSDINSLTPEYTVGFARGCAAIDPSMTWDEVPTHWYSNASSVPDETLAAWQAYAAETPALIMFVAFNADNPFEWAISNLGSQGLQFIPDEPI
jgi:hypothetical protein